MRQAPTEVPEFWNRNCAASAQRGSTNASVPLLRSPLIPGMAQLQWLESLEFELSTCDVRGGIPAAWVAPGAFPRLQR